MHEDRPGDAPRTGVSEQQEARDLLLADLAHFGDSYLRNEEMGERRVGFLVTLVTAVSGGILALATSDRAVDPALLWRVTAIAATTLAIIGLFTYLRLLHRNATTDEYLKTLRYLRRALAAGTRVDPYAVPIKCSGSLPPGMRGGQVEMVSLLVGALVTVAIAASFRPNGGSSAWCWPVVSGVGVSALLMVGSHLWRSRGAREIR